jgi:sulfur-carrier protein
VGLKCPIISHLIVNFVDRIVKLRNGKCHVLLFSMSVIFLNVFHGGEFLMAILVRIPSPLRQYTEQKSEVMMEGNTIGEVLENLKIRFPEAGTRFFSTRTARFMNLYLNDTDIRSLNDLNTQVGEKDVLSIVFAIAGG